jgi:hypothetical protein
MIGGIYIPPFFMAKRNTKHQNFQFKHSHRITATNFFFQILVSLACLLKSRQHIEV